MNLVLRDRYVEDCERAFARWNKLLASRGLPDRLRLPSQRFNRDIGLYARMPFSPEGSLLTPQQWAARREEFLPCDADRAYVRSLMIPVYEPGRFAPWIAPPAKGINGKPLDFDYVRFAGYPGRP
jgi:benzoyl-CoA 2,3-dioxygenase component B